MHILSTYAAKPSRADWLHTTSCYAAGAELVVAVASVGVSVLCVQKGGEGVWRATCGNNNNPTTTLVRT